MRYVEQVSINPGIGSTSGYAYRANSIYDPNYSGVGHQPMGHDQWANFYNHYVVIGSRIKVTATAEDAGDPMVWGIILNDDATAPSGVSALIETGRGTYCFTGAVSKTGRVRSLNYSPRRFHNITNIKDYRALGATFGSNPTEEAYYVIWAASMNTATEPGQMDFIVQIDYLVAMQEPKDLSTS